MSNNWFQFKQFTIQQDRCAMKVTTDACILGAWTPLHSTTTRILDAGTGSGLLALMLAQRSPAIIDAAEIEGEAAAQAAENVRQSPWKERICVKTGDIRHIELKPPYDLLISNPPFFNNSLLGPAEARNRARHTLSMSYADLLRIAENNLAPNGVISILLPAEEHKLWEQLCTDNGWYISDMLNITHRPGAVAKRKISVAGRRNTATVENDLYIYDHDGSYAAGFRHLMQDYYLAF